MTESVLARHKPYNYFGDVEITLSRDGFLLPVTREEKKKYYEKILRTGLIEDMHHQRANRW